MSFRYGNFFIERISPRYVVLKALRAKDRTETIGRYPGYAGALHELLSRLAEDGRDTSEIEVHWEKFSRHLQDTYALATALEEVGA